MERLIMVRRASKIEWKPVEWSEDELKQMIKDQIIYDPITGVIVRKDGRPPTPAEKGFLFRFWKGSDETAGSSMLMRASHIAWFLHTGEWIDETREHIIMMDMDHMNLKFDNLRKASGTDVIAHRLKCASWMGEPPTSKYKGVSWCKEKKLWQAYITCNGKRYTLGRYADEEVAANAYNVKALELFGEFAVLNPCPPRQIPPRRKPGRPKKDVNQ